MSDSPTSQVLRKNKKTVKLTPIQGIILFLLITYLIYSSLIKLSYINRLAVTTEYIQSVKFETDPGLWGNESLNILMY